MAHFIKILIKFFYLMLLSPKTKIKFIIERDQKMGQICFTSHLERYKNIANRGVF